MVANIIVHRSIYVLQPLLCAQEYAACLSCTGSSYYKLKKSVYFGFNLRSTLEQTLESFCLAFAHPCDLFGLQCSVELREKFERICLVARPCDLFWLQTPVKFRAKIRELLARYALICDLFGLQSPAEFSAKKQDRFYLASLGQAIDFGFNLRSHSEKNSKTSAALRSAIRFILASISSRIQSKHSRASASLRVAMQFILASNSGQIWSKCTTSCLTDFASLRSLIRFPAEFRARTRKFLLRFAWPCKLFWLPSPVEFRAKFLKKIISFARFTRPCDLFWLQSTVEFRENTRELLPRFAWPCNLFWLQTPVKFGANIRPIDRFCLASLADMIYLGSLSGRI